MIKDSHLPVLLKVLIMRFERICIFMVLVVSITASEEEKPSMKSVNNRATKTMKPQDRRKSALFPRKLIKFTITPLPRMESVSMNHMTTPRVTMRKITPKYKTTEAPFYFKPISRKPFLKIKKYTIGLGLTTRPVTNPNLTLQINNLKDKEDSLEMQEDNTKAVQFDFPQNADENESITEIDVEFNEKLTTSMKPHLKKYAKTQKKQINVAQKLRDRSKRTEERNKESSLSSEEEEDMREFIFLPKSFRRITRDLFADDMVEMPIKVSPKSRYQRSVNIIEEEQMGSTISGLKFTARPSESELNGDVAFKNINT